jgi:Zn ribbon nucleic-acid-binding protein
MGVNGSPGRRAVETAAATCPACGAADPAIAFATHSTTYLLCRVCEHVWQTGPSPVDDAWTSMAFRITRRKMTRPTH